MKTQTTILLVLFVSALFLNGCSRSYSGQFFSYPPGTKPHENDWKYLGKIITWDPSGKKATDRGEREIEITITDKNKKVLLQDTLKLNSASIEGRINWDTFEDLSIDLLETGNPYAEDEYNKNLIKGGPRHLLTLRYSWAGEQFNEQ